MSRLEKILLIYNVLLYTILAIFSYAYVDLNLTLSQNPQVLSFVNFMQQLGYFNRPIATLIYLILIIFTFSLFILHLFLFNKSKIGLKYLKISTVINTLIIIFAYPFLSSDLFNYLFDAKIILNYQANPYTHRPLDFPNDEWLRFMRWVHRYSPYGPLWLGYTLIPATLGFGKFILNFFTFKIFISVFHLINAVLVYKILIKIKPKLALFGTAFYSLNPTLLLEGVANTHNDVVLATFLIAPIYFIVQGKITLSYTTLVIGALIKYIPILNLPYLILYTLYPKFRHSVKMDRVQLLVAVNLVTITIFTFLFSSFKIYVPFISSGATQVQFQPWYLFWTIPFVAILANKNIITIFAVLTFGASLRYLPFLYYGDWSHPGTIQFMQIIVILPTILIAVALLLKKYSRI